MAIWSLGSEFDIRWMDGKEERLKVSESTESNSNIVSPQSPMGSALLGSTPGLVEYETPQGTKMEFALLMVYLPDDEAVNNLIAKRVAKSLAPSYKTVIEKVKAGTQLTAEEIDILKNKRNFKALAVYYEKQFQNSSLTRDAVQASSYWRKAKKPARALKATMPIEKTDSRDWAVVLNTRGGALKDMGVLTQALRYANESIDLSPNTSHGYNLRGAVLIRTERYEEALDDFQKASELGSKGIKQQISKELKGLDGSKAELIKEFLNHKKVLDSADIKTLREKLK